MEQKEQIAAIENPVETTPVEEKPKKKLSKIEKKKLRVINKLIAGEINGTQAAKKLKLSTTVFSPYCFVNFFTSNMFNPPFVLQIPYFITSDGCFAK